MIETIKLGTFTLNYIVVEVYHSKHGSFLKAIADAWLKADVPNKGILRPAWVAIIKKYNLEEEYKAERPRE